MATMELVDAMLRMLFAHSTDSKLFTDTTLNPDDTDTADANASVDSSENMDNKLRLLLQESKLIMLLHEFTE